ncbi:formate--tetrahydrofolate ligase [Vagococcus intermedius]|uniref:Formate--tetrahydrofolate ligase n=1 Tax=Vagococcus intermedius TaxID=2991418 RepID=A0AAF0I6S2_9ENTE|nr:formate--tetrahydrofolate ligase [Vagococcus intermedius]WEG72556.1 formate--tetrahydrofolate ligase [Vagococcus intermedius]WEG74642.1 formate--tetrahydrofolate ligase [Vagococcus intermedius]
MKIPTDIEIATETTMLPIKNIAEKMELQEDSYELYGKYKAKINSHELKKMSNKKNGKLILVTAISPTPAGEGKTTTSVGLADGLAKIGKRAMLALREPSLGPVFGMKGGATGGGYAQVVPMEEINLHFTGDFHAIGVANNLLAALIDNHIHHGNILNIDSQKITWKRVVDMNDRQLRHIVSGLQGKVNGVTREDGYDITVASEIMAILCLSNNIVELKDKLRQIIIGYNSSGDPVTAGDLKAEGALTALLKEAINPNLVQTLNHTPALIHGGPFANIAHGCNSILATKLAMKYADFAITEAGFGSDLGAEKFIDIKCRMADIQPDAVVLVATIRALKMHGGVSKKELNKVNKDAILEGLPNLKQHLVTIKEVYGLPVVVALNKFETDTAEELELVKEYCLSNQTEVVLSEAWEKGADGSVALAESVVRLANQTNDFSYVYDLTDSIEDKLTKVVQKVYGGNGVTFSKKAYKELNELNRLGFSNYPICMAKTQFSFSDQVSLIGAPKDFDINIASLKISAGAGFIVALTGSVMTMPGLPKHPASEGIDVNEDGDITGLF